MKYLVAYQIECKDIEAKARKDNKDSSACIIMNHIEIEILKSHKLSKSYYYGNNLQDNDV